MRATASKKQPQAWLWTLVAYTKNGPGNVDR